MRSGHTGEEIVGAYGPDSISYYTTGGGFSAIFPRQPWQEASVSAYLAEDGIQSELPPTSVYRAEGTMKWCAASFRSPPPSLFQS